MVMMELKRNCLWLHISQPEICTCIERKYALKLTKLENPSPVFQTGLGFSARAELQPRLNPSPCNRQFHFMRISFRNRAEISAQLSRLKFAM